MYVWDTFDIFQYWTKFCRWEAKGSNLSRPLTSPMGVMGGMCGACVPRSTLPPLPNILYPTICPKSVVYKILLHLANCRALTWYWSLNATPFPSPPLPHWQKLELGCLLISYHPMYWNWSLIYKIKLIIKSNSQNLNCCVKNIYVQELKDHLPPECEDNLSKGDWDLHQSQESVSIIAKNLDCGYAHEVWNCPNACRESKIWVIKMANHDKRKYHLKMMQTQDKNEETE